MFSWCTFPWRKIFPLTTVFSVERTLELNWAGNALKTWGEFNSGEHCLARKRFHGTRRSTSMVFFTDVNDETGLGSNCSLFWTICKSKLDFSGHYFILTVPGILHQLRVQIIKVQITKNKLQHVHYTYHNCRNEGSRKFGKEM